MPVRQTVVIDPDGGNLQQVDVTYSRGNYRMPPSHLLNTGLNWRRQRRNGEATWTFSVYNLYNQMNSDLLLSSPANRRRSSSSFTATHKVRSVTIIPILPSIGYSYKF